MMITIMKKLLPLLFALMMVSCASDGSLSPSVFTHTDSAKQSSYRIGYGDVLYISVWKEEAMTRQAAVLPDGNITFPLIGEVNAYGKTVRELKAAIEKRLAKYMSGVTLSVEVVKPNSMMIYVIGKVNSPGNFLINEKINVMQALTLARGLNTFADKNKIRIFRNVDGNDHIYIFNYEDVSEGKNLEQNILLERGDMIVVQ